MTKIISSIRLLSEDIVEYVQIPHFNSRLRVWFICLMVYQPLMSYSMLKFDSFVKVYSQQYFQYSNAEFGFFFVGVLRV